MEALSLIEQEEVFGIIILYNLPTENMGEIHLDAACAVDAGLCGFIFVAVKIRGDSATLTLADLESKKDH